MERDGLSKTIQNLNRIFQLTRSRGAWHILSRSRPYFPYFNSHAHVERDQEFSFPSPLSWDFNSHAHVERDACRPWRRTSLMIFQLTRSRGAWRLTNEQLKAEILFQLTRSRGAWRKTVYCQYVTKWFQLTRSRGAWRITAWARHELFNFNSHAHVERDFKFVSYHSYQKISTHTLTWSVTRHNQNIKSSLYISTHTLTWSVTTTLKGAAGKEVISTHTLTWSVTAEFFKATLNGKFQLTRSRGAWLKRGEKNGFEKNISTHTLTWSVTL